MDDLYKEANEMCAVVKKPTAERYVDYYSLKMTGVLDRLFNVIKRTIRPAVKEAASCGVRDAVAFTFEGMELFEGEPILFLIKGPRTGKRVFGEWRSGKGTQFFKDLGIVPVLERLNDACAPLTVTFRYDYAANSNNLVVKF